MKKFLVLLLVICFVISAAGTGFAANTKAFEFAKFNAKNNDRFEASFDENGNVRNLAAKDAKFFSAKGDMTPEKAAKIAFGFIKDNAGLFNITNIEDIKLDNVAAAGNVNHVLFNQFYRGKKVQDAFISVHVNNAGNVVMANNSTVQFAAASILTSVIDEKQAIEIAKKHINCTEPRNTINAYELVYSLNKIAVNVIRVDIPSKEPLGDFVTIIDATNGKVLESYDIMNHSKADDVKVPVGSVYVSNPLKCKVTNEALTNINKDAKGLVGKWATIVNEDAPPAVPNAEGNYIYAPENTNFDEVCAYYYINTIHEFNKRYNFTGLDRSIKCTVHYGDKYDNAFFSPMEGSISLGDGNKLNDLAKEESVTYHEYTHASTNAIVNLPYTSQSGAMSEAFSDYYACTMTDDPEVGEWAVNKMNRPYIRTLVNKNHFPEDIQNEVHYDSSIYGGGLWDLRKAIGVEAADKIIHFSRYYLKGIKNQKFTDGVKALIAADKEYYAGANAETITKIFEARGIKLQKGVSTMADLKDSLRFEALNGDKAAAQMLTDIENGNIK